ncbi:MAG: CYTH domain-containing protein [Candidatus Micrarchaeia archaeon]
MAKEIELPIYGVDPEYVRARLGLIGAKLVGKHQFRRVNFQVKKPAEDASGEYHTKWIRVRTDGKKSTITLKEQNGKGIGGRLEYEVEVSDFEQAVKIVHRLMPDAEYDYFENYREEYALGEFTIELDKFPMLEYSMEIEGPSEESVKELYRKMDIKGAIEGNKSIPTEEYYRIHGFDYSKLQESYAEKIASLLSDS